MFDPTLPNGATLSPCGKYRYTLWRTVDDGMFATGGNVCCFVMLNPSVADHSTDDPTIRRCMDFTLSWGYRKLYVVNLFAFRATFPIELRKTREDPIGPDNDKAIMLAAEASDLIICGWGSHGSLRSREVHVLKMLRDAGHKTHYLKKSLRTGQPWHPLFLPATCSPIEWN